MKDPKITRREFIGSLAAAGALASTAIAGQERSEPIDRFALVSRHDPILQKIDPLSPLSVGNGEFAFTCDVTGLQTFPEPIQERCRSARCRNGAGTRRRCPHPASDKILTPDRIRHLTAARSAT